MPITMRGLLCAVLTLGLAVSSAFSQTENPVYLDDSPQAWELFRQAQDQTRNNAGEAVRLYQELLDEFTMRLIPASDVASSHYKAVRSRVLATIVGDAALLDRYRLIQKQAAQQMLQADQLEQLAMTRSLTESGLEALLRLAQRELEAGRFNTALSWLAESQRHPDLAGRRAAHVHYMIATAAIYGNDSQRAHDSLLQLQQMGADADHLREGMKKLAADAANRGLAPQASISTLGVGNATASELQDLVAQAIWSVPLPDSLLRRRMAISQDEPLGSQPIGISNSAIEQRLRDADFTTVTPTVVGETVYVNEGHTIRALNRLTGRQLWEYSNLNRISATDRDVQGSLDLSVVAVGDGAVVALTGHALPNARSDSGRIICLDAETGSYRWPATLSNIPGMAGVPSNEQLFPHGAPIIADQMVFIAARRVTMQSMTSAYVVALDLADGKVRWVRYITSSGGLRPLRPFDSLVHDGDALYIASTVGATARIEPATGETKWLVRFAAPFNTGFAEQRRPWEMTGPVVTPRGLLMIEPDLRHIVLLDAETGSQLESYPSAVGTDWNAPRYLIADDHYVYAIGNEIRAFELENLEHAIWKLPHEDFQRSVIGDQPGADSRAAGAGAASRAPALELRGRVQLVQGALVAPTSDGVLVIDAERGEVLNRLPVQFVGNPLAIESQLLMACGDRIESYMSFSKAEQMLRDRLAQMPSDPEPALSLLRLGMRVENLSLSLEAANLATRAINAGTAESRLGNARDELMSLLLELAAAGIASNIEEGELLYAALNTAAVGSQQRVDYLLAYGDWLARNDLDRAVESYQAILSDRMMAESWRIDNGAMRPASAWALQRLIDLIALRGATAYASQADFAGVRLKQIRAAAVGNDPDPIELVALANEFPFSDAAVDAAIQASNIQISRNNHRAAASTLLHAYRTGGTAVDHKSRLLGNFVSVCMQAQWHDQVEAAIRYAALTYPNTQLATSQGSLSPANWLIENTSTGKQLNRRFPSIGDIAAAESQSIAGSMVPPSRNGSAFTSASAAMLGSLSQPSPVDKMLTRSGESLKLFSGDMDEPKWSATFATEQFSNLTTLQFDQSNVLLWSEADAADPKAIMINATDGTVRWTTPSVRELFGEQTPDAARSRGVREQMPDGEIFESKQIVPVASDKSIFLVQRNGNVAALDLTDGKTVRWSRTINQNQVGLNQVHAVLLHDSALVLAGAVRVGGGSNDMIPKVVALDPQTGQSLFADSAAFESFGRSGVKWMRISPLGTLVVGTTQGLHAVDLLSGNRLWSNASYGALDTQRAWLLGEDRIVLEDQRSRLRQAHMRDGIISEPFETPMRGEWDPQELRNVQVNGGRVIAHYPQRVVVYDGATGSIIGADVVSDDRDYRWLLLAQNQNDRNGRMVVVNGRSTQAALAEPGAPAGRRTTQWMYRMYVLSENGKALGNPMELRRPLSDRVEYATLIDGWLLMSTRSETVCIPMGD